MGTNLPIALPEDSLVAEAAAAIRAFAGPAVSWTHAATLLQLWHARPSMTDAEIVAVLANFERR